MKKILCGLLACTLSLTACSDEEGAYLLQRSDITLFAPQGSFVAQVGKPFCIKVKSVSDEGLSYRWYNGNHLIAQTKDLEYTFLQKGQYHLKLVVTQGERSFEYAAVVEVKGEGDAPSDKSSPYITRVLDYRPAPGQFVNELPTYQEGDTQEDINRKVLDAIGNNNMGTISLGGYGGYVIVGFDHTLRNVAGKRDFRILGNAFEGNGNAQLPEGNAEPGIIMVSEDSNRNGIADDEWYEIAGSAHRDPQGESWIDLAKAAGNDVNLYMEYAITYHRPHKEPETAEDFSHYIRWEDNQGHSGFRKKNSYHAQPYFPQWITDDQLTFQGTCLPQNGIDYNGDGSYFVNYKMRYGYADNVANNNKEATIDIDWAVDAQGKSVQLAGIDFIKIYTGVNQENGWIGECSTEITGIEDLHILKEDINSEVP